MQPMRNALSALLVALAILVVTDLAVRQLLPQRDRLDENFSATYLARVVASQHDKSPIVVLGDSALWGYGLPTERAAATILRRAGRPIENFAYEGGSAPNSVALLKLLLARGVRPRMVIFNVNQKEFNPSDSAYSTLHPSVERLAWQYFSASDQSLLTRTQAPTPDRELQNTMENVWQLYGMRTDIREMLFNDVDAAHLVQTVIQTGSGTRARVAAAHRPTPERFEGTYDLAGLSPANTGFHFLVELATIVQANRIPAIAILTPTNHRLLHTYIDVPEYRQNVMACRRMLEQHGVRVLDLDRAFEAAVFLDNDHLDALGNERLASILERAL